MSFTQLLGPSGNVIGSPPRIWVPSTIGGGVVEPPPPHQVATRPWFGASSPEGLIGFAKTENEIIKRKLDMRRTFSSSFVQNPRPLVEPDLDAGRVPMYSCKEPTSNVVASWTTWANHVVALNKFWIFNIRHEPENDGISIAQFEDYYTTMYTTVKPIVGDLLWIGPIWMGVSSYAANRAAWWALNDTIPMDILMIDAYNQLNKRSFANIFKFTAAKARALGKPWGICEVATHGTDDERAAWWKGAQTYWEHEDNEDLKFVIEYNSDLGDNAAYVGWRPERALPDGWYPQEIPERNNPGHLYARAKPADVALGIEWVTDLKTPAQMNASMNTPRRQLGPIIPPPEPPPEPPEYGALALGATNYSYPADAKFVDVTGGVDATTSGAEATPYKTLKYALTRLPAGGGTIVLRAGDYPEENITTPWRVTPITIQAYPGEVVRFMGSDVVTGWVQDNTGPGGTNRWRKNNWVTNFDRTPNAETLIDPAHPESQWPEQVWIDDIPLEQVSSLADVDATAPNEAGSPGTFWYDTVAKVMWIGTTPFGKTARIAKRQLAISGQIDADQGNPRVDILGIGFYHYATSSKQLAAVRVYGPDTLIKHCHFIGCSMAGVFTQLGEGVRIHRNTFYQCGQLSIHGYKAPWMDIGWNHISFCNRKMTATDSAGGGLKLDTDCIAAFTHHNYLDSNYGHGIWIDIASHFSATWRNEVVGHLEGWGIHHELMIGGLVTGNLVYDNAYGVLIGGSCNHEIYNNTFKNNTHHLRIQYESRPNTPGTSYTNDQNNFTIRNNLFVQTITDNAVIMIEYQDTTGGTHDYAEQNITSDDNAFYFEARGTAKTAKLTIPGTTTWTAYNLLADVQAATTLEDNSMAVYENVTNPYLTGDDPLLPYGPIIEAGSAVPEKVWSRLDWTVEEGATPNIGAY